jgi:hypothetical protein
MAFSSTGFSTASASKAGNSPSIHTYSTADAVADVNTAGYFNSIASLLKVGDVIFAQTGVGGTLVMSILWVNSNTGTVVDVVDGLTVTATDSD